MVATVRARKAVIPAAGLGTRFLPLTKASPKELLPMGEVPSLQLVIEEAVGAGVGIQHRRQQIARSHDLVGQQHRERLAADELLRHAHCCPSPSGSDWCTNRTSRRSR